MTVPSLHNRAAAIAARAARDGDRENIDEGNAEGMRRSRAPDHRDVLDIMQQSAVTSIRGLTRVFERQVAAQNQPAGRNSSRIVDLYKRRKLAVEAGREAAIIRYDAMIDALEEEEEKLEEEEENGDGVEQQEEQNDDQQEQQGADQEEAANGNEA